MNASKGQTATIIPLIIENTGFAPMQVEQTVKLLDEGATVPFIARYRKELTGELNEVDIRLVEDSLIYFRELEERKVTIMSSIEDQGRLTGELQQQIIDCRQKAELEDLYLPYKPKRRTRASIAKERGLEPLADLMAAQQLTSGNPLDVGIPFVDPENGVTDASSALEGAGHILAERLAENAEIRSLIRRLTWDQGVITSRVAAAFKGQVTKFEMYYDYQEQLKTVPSHRMLAMRRGENEGVLILAITAPVDKILEEIRSRTIVRPSIFEQLLGRVAEDAYKRLIAPSIEVELRLLGKERADEAAIQIFASNLRDLLLAPPVGSKIVLGIDPGFRTGSKLAAIDGTGRLLEHLTVYPHIGEGRVSQAKNDLIRLIESYTVEMVAVGNGTAGREMELFVKGVLTEIGKSLPVISVSEAGASIYSASEIARDEFPDLDLTVRGAISIARRLQDPLGELVKIDPKSIGVGQYQHDVNQGMLKKSLDAVVESCVNHVGVDLNTASWALLSYVSGIGPALAKSIVRYRDEHGVFDSRMSLLSVPRFGARAFEQAAGFLRIQGGRHPLDNTSVHPERYQLVESILSDMGMSVSQLSSTQVMVECINLNRYISSGVGLPTLKDIIQELKKPGRDPRSRFQSAVFLDEIKEVSHLHEGMILQGVVTNVTAFGAFVDVGVHQDGLVHISHLANRFVKNPAELVKAGQVVKVKVLSADVQRKRIALSIKDAI